ncbi:LamG-like jellyroll fold domain-containing protein [Niabella aurantiaca]|uniref:LamG-like jellyroll fold domain-containing protein n=1 Tax=Niabella aurantiaca TaxID=379900 RepID=UPI00035CD393|nr:LamG-like jellyroll fold domain-containing protein [Niabella aurantiaca]
MKRVLYSAFLIVSVLCMATSCKKYADPPPYFEDDIDSGSVASRRVLLIGIDGAVATEYKEMALPALSGLLAHSKFTWEGISDAITTDAASWKTLMTGISYVKHHIKDSSFIYEAPPGGDPHGGAPPNYPSFFSYILSSPNGNMRTSFISSWGTMVNRLVPEALDQVIATGDQGVKDSALSRIRNGNPELMVLNFDSPAKAGKAGAFSASDAGYKDAATKVDGYINEIMTALKARPEYNKKEEWLVIVNSTHGGIGNSYGGSSLDESSAFSIYYNENFKSLELTKEGAYIGAFLSGNGNTAVKAVMSDPDAYNPGTGPMTIELKVRGSRKSGNWPAFISKKGPFEGTSSLLGSSDAGFVCYSSGSNDANFVVKSVTTSGNPKSEGGSTAILDGNNWHTLSIVFRQDSAGKKWFKFYNDGIYQDGRDITGYGAITSSAPLVLGFARADDAAWYTGLNVADVRIFDVALTGQEIADNLCLADMKQHPKYANLTGYWPCSDGFGDRFLNHAPGAVNKDFILKNAFSWANVSPLPCSFAPINDPNKRSMQLANSGVANTIFYWLRLPTKDAWGFEGTKWLQDYEIEFIK